VQKFGNLGLKWLCLDGGFGSRHLLGSREMESLDIASRALRSSFRDGRRKAEKP
jgi:hypothetical protein